MNAIFLTYIACRYFVCKLNTMQIKYMRVETESRYQEYT